MGWGGLSRPRPGRVVAADMISSTPPLVHDQPALLLLKGAGRSGWCAAAIGAAVIAAEGLSQTGRPHRLETDGRVWCYRRRRMRVGASRSALLRSQVGATAGRCCFGTSGWNRFGFRQTTVTCWSGVGPRSLACDPFSPIRSWGTFAAARSDDQRRIRQTKGLADDTLPQLFW